MITFQCTGYVHHLYLKPHCACAQTERTHAHVVAWTLVRHLELAASYIALTLVRPLEFGRFEPALLVALSVPCVDEFGFCAATRHCGYTYGRRSRRHAYGVDGERYIPLSYIVCIYIQLYTAIYSYIYTAAGAPPLATTSMPQRLNRSIQSNHPIT